MPYKIVPFKNGYRLVMLKNPSHMFSKYPMTYGDVVKQMQAIEMHKHNIGGISKQEILKQKPSAYRSMQLSKYGYSEGKNKGKLKTWIDEKWLNLNALLQNQELPCGKKYKGQTDKTVCRPKFKIEKSTPTPLAYQLTREQIMKAINLKNDGHRINWKNL